ncbi:peptidase U32 family protein [Sneathiella sp.]|uniref:ubiquinone anaerobic biosynthesis protein UbiU n=1 Tax=Sneathiella sp. TaxID=1964365 RepID=UPI00260833DB|nr:peptidase U32 family protein [Sneathiella sp.]MDF2368450.1 U32 family peptidase [Sneathiella sp.]
MELVCPAGTPSALKAALEAGADVVYVGFRDETNARNFPGLNFSPEELRVATAQAQSMGRQIYVAINTYPEAGNLTPWHRAVDLAADIGVDAVIMADIGLLDYTTRRHPTLRRHLSVQASASNPEAVNFYRAAFDVQRVVLPRVLTVREIKDLIDEIEVEAEVFAFGGMCVMAEGRCSLSSYITGKSPNMNGVCSPASHVDYEQRGRKLISKLGDFTINAYPDGEAAGYPTLCKGRFFGQGDDPSYLFEEPTSLNVMALLPELINSGVKALKIEGRQRGKAYVSQVVSSYRRAIDAVLRGEALPDSNLGSITEGARSTAGAYQKSWR